MLFKEALISVLISKKSFDSPEGGCFYFRKEVKNMFNIENLPKLAEAYVKKYPPNTGYTIRAAKAVYDAYKAGKLPPGTNIGVQLALQYDGKEVGGDLISGPEKQLPYLASYSLDKGADCADFIRNLILLLFGRNIGDWTEGIYQRNKERQVPWEERREMDVLLNKLSDRNPHATHAMLYIGGGQMLHTTSKSNALRVESDTKYAPSTRTGTGVFRVLTDEEYNSLIVPAIVVPTPSAPPKAVPKRTRSLKYELEITERISNVRTGPGMQYPSLRTLGRGQRLVYLGKTGDWYKVYYNGAARYIHDSQVKACAQLHGDDVKAVQQALKDKGFDPGSVDGWFGPKTAAAVVAYQTAMGLKVDGIVGPITWESLFA